MATISPRTMGGASTSPTSCWWWWWLFAGTLAGAALLAACADDDAEIELDVQPPSEPVEPGEPPTDEGREQQMERHIFEAVNLEREERGVPPLEWSDQLADGAREWSSDMAGRRVLEHEEPQAILERVEGLEAIGENVAQGAGPFTAGRLHQGWMESDGHRRNVVDPGFDRIGVGVVCTDDGEVFATQRFGRTAGADLPAPAEGNPPEDPIVADPDEGPTC